MHPEPGRNQTMKGNSLARLHDSRNARVLPCVHTVISAAIPERRASPQTCGQASVLRLANRTVKRHLWSRNVVMRQDNVPNDSVHLAKHGTREHRKMKISSIYRYDRDRQKTPKDRVMQSIPFVDKKTVTATGRLHPLRIFMRPLVNS